MNVYKAKHYARSLSKISDDDAMQNYEALPDSTHECEKCEFSLENCVSEVSELFDNLHFFLDYWKAEKESLLQTMVYVAGYLQRSKPEMSETECLESSRFCLMSLTKVICSCPTTTHSSSCVTL